MGRIAVLCALTVVLAAAAPAAARPDAAGSAVKYPRINERYELVDFRGFGRHFARVVQNGQTVMDGSWTVEFSYKGGTVRLKNPTRSKKTPNARVEPLRPPTLELRARTWDNSAGYPTVAQECRQDAPAGLPKAFVYYGPNAIQLKVKRVPTNRLEIHWVLPTFPDLSCGGLTSRIPASVPRSGRRTFTLTYTYERFKAPGAVTPFEFSFPYDNGDGTQGYVSWRGRLIVKRMR